LKPEWIKESWFGLNNFSWVSKAKNADNKGLSVIFFQNCYPVEVLYTFFSKIANITVKKMVEALVLVNHYILSVFGFRSSGNTDITVKKSKKHLTFDFPCVRKKMAMNMNNLKQVIITRKRRY